jgi:NitT/TauT family transport system ATP-binding protein
MTLHASATDERGISTSPRAPAAQEPASNPMLRITDLSIAFGTRTIVENLSFEVPRGDFITMVGPSGCGKSTTLNAISQLLPRATARVEGRIEIAPDARLSYAFQRDALLPWASARRNVEIGAQLGGTPKRDRSRIARELLDHVGLADVDGEYPHELSGGMRQRVSLARALAYRPDLFLLDEPFGALDAFTRMDLQNKLSQLWRESGTTMVLVTHDLAEALVLGTKVIVLAANPGRIHDVVDNTEWGVDRKAQVLRSDPAFNEKYRQLFDTLVRLSTPESDLR